LSSDIRITRIVTVAISSVTALAIAATALVGITGWNPARAAASPAPETITLFGVDEQTAVVLGSEVTTDAKFEGALAIAPLSAETSLGAPAERRTSVIKTPPAPIARPVAMASKVHRAPRVRPKTKWRRARVSWYGPGFYGHGMAGGGRLKRTSMVVAHRSMKFGTKVQLRYKGRTVIAVVKDRGPFVSGRTFDLGPGTARALHFSGVGKVKWRIVK